MNTQEIPHGDDTQAVRRERRLLDVEVRRVRPLSPHMTRITVGGGALEDFPVLHPAQWVKLFVPAPAGEKPRGRAYTIRAYSRDEAEMDIDFVLHGDGPCSSWAQQAQVGDVIQIAGPRGGFRLDPAVRRLLIGGDETALPAIGAILEALPSGVVAETFIEVPDERDIQSLRSAAAVSVTWLPRNKSPAGTVTALQDAMVTAPTTEDSSVWIAAEASVVRALRCHFQTTAQLDRRRITSSGYWKQGETDFRDTEGDQ